MIPSFDIQLPSAAFDLELARRTGTMQYRTRCCITGWLLAGGAVCTIRCAGYHEIALTHESTIIIIQTTSYMLSKLAIYFRCSHVLMPSRLLPRGEFESRRFLISEPAQRR